MRSSLLAACIAAALLAGCGGGGGSSPAVPGGSTSPQSSLSTTDIAETGADVGFEPMDDGSADATTVTLASGTISSAARAPQTIAHGCQHRTTRKVTVNGDGSITVETIHYYDDACTQVERDAVDVYASSNGTATIARTVTTFNQAALQLGVRKSNYVLSGSASNGSWVVTSAFYPGTSTTFVTQVGRAVSLTGTAYAANGARIVNDAKPSVNASYGRQFITGATLSTDASNDVTFTGTRNGTIFKGALGALSMPSAPPFAISGGSQVGTSSLTGSVTFDSDGNLTAVALNGTLPSGNTITVSSSTAANGAVTVTGTITSPSGTQVATFVTDASGNGILTLANGTQVPIVDWHVIW